MSSVSIEMPKLSDTMTEGTLLRWRKKEGDQVKVGDILAEIETDKAVMEMEAFDDGILGRILVPEGAKAPVGTQIAELFGKKRSMAGISLRSTTFETQSVTTAPPPLFLSSVSS